MFDDYFTKKNPKIKIFMRDLLKFGKQKEPTFPEYDINIIQDSRVGRNLPNYLIKNRKDFSIHTIISLSTLCNWYNLKHFTVVSDKLKKASTQYRIGVLL